MRRWKDKISPDNTYRNLLEVCVQGEWSDAANAIIEILKGIFRTNKEELANEVLI